MVGVKSTDSDPRASRALHALAAIGDRGLSIGVNDAHHVPAPGRTDPGLTNAQIGAIHEFGLGNNPERSFLRAWLDDESNWMPELERRIGAAVDAAESGLNTDKWLEDFAAFCVKSIQDRMRAGIAPPILASTLNRKQGGDAPLIDTEQLLNAIEAHVGLSASGGAA